MKKKIFFFKVFIVTCCLNVSAQNQYFTEFLVPGLNTNEEAKAVTNLLSELGAYSIRADKYSQKVISLSEQSLLKSVVEEKFNANNFSLTHFNSGIQGIDNYQNLQASNSDKKAAVTASDCSEAVNICSDPTFTIEPNGTGLVNDIPASGTIGNPATNPTSANLGCLLAGETNSTWMRIIIEQAGDLEFTFGVGTQAGYYDWIIWPFDDDCGVIAGGTIAPISCNWNSADSGGTGAVSIIPVGGDSGNYEPSIPVNCGDQYIVCFSNYSATTSLVPIQFGGTAGVSCSEFQFEVESSINTLSNDSILFEGIGYDTLTFTRLDTALALTVYYNVSGNAINGVDYNLLEDSVEFLAGEGEFVKVIQAIEDIQIEGLEDVIISYNQHFCGVGSSSEIKFYISDTASIATNVGYSGDISNNGIIIYPSPTRGEFNIEKAKELKKEIKFKVFDGLSRLIVEEAIPIGDNTRKVDISNEPDGIYFLQLTIGEEVFLEKIIKN